MYMNQKLGKDIQNYIKLKIIRDRKATTKQRKMSRKRKICPFVKCEEPLLYTYLQQFKYRQIG